MEDLRLPLILAYLKEVGSDPARRCSRDAAGRAGAADEHRGRRRRTREASQRGHPLLPRVAGEIPARHADRRGDLPERPGRGRTHREDLRGPVHEQVRDALRYIQNSVIREKVVKRKDRAEATRLFNYPFPAVEESLVNAVYHRSYEMREPVEVRVNPDGIEIVSYPGPDASIRIEALNGDKIVARRYRNRRIGEFLKELDLTEGRCTGFPLSGQRWPRTARLPRSSRRTRGGRISSWRFPSTRRCPGQGKRMRRRMRRRMRGA